MSVFIKYLVTFFFITLMFWVALLNRVDVSFSLFPFFESQSIPFSILFVAAVFVGFIWGGLIVWLNNADLRQGFRRLRYKLKRMEKAPATKNIMPS